MDVLEDIQNWYSSMCNGDWEHTYGITIESIDNPGWAVSIELKDTPLYSATFKSVKVQREDENDWILCRVEDGIFKGDCGPKNLREVLTIFLQFARSITDPKHRGSG